MTSRFDRTLWLLAALLGGTASAHAWPSTSPSAIEAARLKHHPPKNWLQHYLPDDRYKIAGGVWKVVSTQLDTYYHRPDSPNMLRQPAEIVIGFSSEQEAREAGYRPDGMFFPGSAVSGGMSRPRARIGVAETKRVRGVTVSGTRVALSDGSSVLLPAGWTLKRGGLKSQQQSRSAFDMLSPATGTGAKSMVMYMFVDAPGQNLERMADAATVRKMLANSGKNLRQAVNSSGVVNTQLDSFAASLSTKAVVSATQLGGVKGVSVRQGDSSTPFAMSSITAARGSKMYGLIMMGPAQSSPAVRAIVQSFQPA